MSEHGTRRSSRRRLLCVAGTLAAVATAGCSGLVSDSPARTAGEEPQYLLTVRLEDPNGDPVSEASVSVADAEGVIQRAEAKVPSRDGVVSFDLENGDYVIRTESQEYSNVEEPVSIDGEDVEVTITLERGFA
ncbi:hypothetical protein [Halalkalicoccus salilacus]|uniref:hypothetical protein n=1 Tax=Halalkalicoccus salilacus TaxID=3117459 RepID=UPI00300F0B0E